MIDPRQSVVNTLSRTPPKAIWVIAVAPMLSAQSGAAVLQAMPPGHGNAPGPRPDIMPLPTRWQYVCRWAREWREPNPKNIGSAVRKLLERTNEFGRFTFLLDASECGRVFGVAVGTAAGRSPMMVLQSSLGERQVAGPEEERVLRMATAEARGSIAALAADDRFIVAEMPLAARLRAAPLRHEPDAQGAERALAVALWYALRATGDGDRKPKPMPKEEDLSFDEETHRARQWELMDGLSEDFTGQK